jgi:hypothetical protein
VAHTCERATAVRIAALRDRIQRPMPVRLRPANPAPVLPLTPPKLLELAEEFRNLANASPTPAGRAAFKELMMRYTALAAGYDSEQAGSRMLH